MNMRTQVKTRAYITYLIIVFASLAGVLSITTKGQEHKAYLPADTDNPLRELISGYYFTNLTIRALQDDDFDNPAFRWVRKGENLWSRIEGKRRKSCAACHTKGSQVMHGKAASYPKFVSTVGRVVTLEQQINLCRKKKMLASSWPYESNELLAMTAYIRMQSRRMPIKVRIDGAASQTFMKGKKLYYARIGRYGISCAQCHNEHYKKKMYDQKISQGHPNGAPAYRVSTERLTSLHERIRECNRLIYASPYKTGAAELVALELYLNWRAKGLPLEAPAVRR
jgi:sulfur-oxidizing protein SoxA